MIQKEDIKREGRKSMKKTITKIFLCLIVSVFLAGCGNQKVDRETTAQSVSIANPWSDWKSLEEAETAVGFELGIPEKIADTYVADVFRTLNNELLEVIYRYEDYEICVRKQKGEGEDISGDYNKYDTSAEDDFNGGKIVEYSNSNNSAVKQIISYNGYSWSLMAPNGYHEDSNDEFLNYILAK